MKKYLFLILIISFIFIQCNKESNPIDNANDGSLLILGSISNYNSNFNKIYASGFPYSDSSLKFETEINANGSFNLKIPVPSVNHLSSYTPFNWISIVYPNSTFLIDSIHIADSSLKYIRYDLFAQSSLPITYALEINLANITTSGELAEVGDFFISYYYFSSSTKIEGYHKLKIVTQDSTREFITEFNVNTKNGWNKLITKLKSKTANKSVYEVIDIANEQGNWLIGAIGSFLNSVWKF